MKYSIDLGRSEMIQMSSREFGSDRTANVVCKDGSLRVLERRRRLDIRKLNGHYEVFLMERCYLGDEEPKDVRQYQQDMASTTPAEAAGKVAQFIADWEGAEADDREAANEAQRERDLNEG